VASAARPVRAAVLHEHFSEFQEALRIDETHYGSKAVFVILYISFREFKRNLAGGFSEKWNGLLLIL